MRLTLLLTWAGDISRTLVDARELRNPMMQQLHRFTIAISQVSVNHDGRGGTAPDRLVWDQGSGPSREKLTLGLTLIRFLVLLVSCAGLGSRLMVGASLVLMLLPGRVVFVCCEFSSFLGSLQWPADTGDLWHHGVSYLRVLILFEQWAGHRLLSVKVTRPHVRAHRPIFISSVPVSEGTEIWQGCRFVSSMVRALGKLLGGLGRFLPRFGRWASFQAASFGVGAVFSRFNVQAFGILSSSTPQSSLWVIGGTRLVQQRSFWMRH